MKSKPQTSQDSHNATSSQESGDGPTHLNSPAGPEIDPSGPVPAPASHSPAQGGVEQQKTLDIFGRNSDGSSPSHALQSALESRLQARLGGAGSQEYALTWKTWDIEWGPPICALRASGRRTSGKDCFGEGDLATPRAEDARSADTLSSQAGQDLAGWATPDVTNRERSAETQMKCETHRKETYGKNTCPQYLADQAKMAGWATPAAQEPGGTPEQHLARKRAQVAKGVQMGCDAVTTLSHQADLAGWATPGSDEGGGGKSTNPESGGASFATQAKMAGWPTPNQNGTGSGNQGRDGGENLQTTAQAAAWPTPAARDWKGATKTSYEDRGGGKKGEALPKIADLAGWPTPIIQDRPSAIGQDQSLTRTAQAAGWPTASARDRKGSLDLKSRDRTMGTLDEAAEQLTGPEPDGTHAETGKPAAYRLNPLFSLWLQGYPAAWACSKVPETP